jgi:general secretion pathway protein D
MKYCGSAGKGHREYQYLGELRREHLFRSPMIFASTARRPWKLEILRIVPLQNVQRLPIEPELNTPSSQIPSDDRIVMDIIPLKYVSAADMTKILTPFLSEGGHLFSHEAGNVLIITDSSRSMKRLMELLAQFDTEVFSNQRARLYPVKSSEAGKVAAGLKKSFPPTAF